MLSSTVCAEKRTQRRSYGKYSWHILKNIWWKQFTENWILIFLLIDESIKIILKRGFYRPLQLQSGSNSMLLSIYKKVKIISHLRRKRALSHSHWIIFWSSSLTFFFFFFFGCCCCLFVCFWGRVSTTNYVSCFLEHEFHVLNFFDFVLKLK